METKSRKMKFTDLKDMLNQTGEVYGDRPAYIFNTEDKGKFRTITHNEFRENINALGTTLIQMGLKDKRIAVISENRYEWELSYLAVAAGVCFCACVRCGQLFQKLRGVIPSAFGKPVVRPFTLLSAFHDTRFTQNLHVIG